jgi:small-conductance mechanosensitive channel
MEPTGLDTAGLQDALTGLLLTLRLTLRTELTSVWLPIQFGAIALSAFAAWGCAAMIRRRFDLVAVTMGWPAWLRVLMRALIDNFGVLAFMLILGLVRTAIRAWVLHPRTYILGMAVDLATAWVVIALAASVIRNPFINRLVAVTSWTIAALSILGLLDETVAALDSRAIFVGGIRVTPLLILKTAVLLSVALWAATATSNFLDRRVQHVGGLTPSIQVLLGKLIRIGVMTAAIVVVLSAAGIDLSVLAVFTGAIGVGAGLGLQKIVSNFVSGLILLADKSIKPGDVISLGDQFGWVVNMGARYTSVDLKDGRELLVPNEDLITQRVVNWTYSSDLMRLEVKFSATYDSDLHKTRAAAVKAAEGIEQVLKTPPPVCHLTGYGSGAIEYLLWFWIKDATVGPTKVRSEVMIALWDTFKREGVKLPIPGPAHIVLDQPKG